MSQSYTRGVPIDPDATLSNNSDLLVASQKATKTYVDNGLLTKQNVLGFTPVDKGGDTMIGNLILNADPTSGLQAATKQYVDTLVNGIDWKEAAHAATVAALPAYTVSGGGQVLTGVANGAIPTATTDNHAILVTERLLVKDEVGANEPNNGIYVLTQVGSITQPFILTRSADANTPAFLLEATVSVINGATLSNTIWHLTPAAVPIVIGTTNLTWIEISSGGITTLNTLTATTQTFATGTTGTDFNISSATSTHTFNLPDASAVNRGALTSADWTTFNSKEPALTKGNLTEATSSVLTISGGTNAVIGSGTSIQVAQASGSTNGYLSSADWTTFNGKQDLLVSGTNIKTINLTSLLGSGNIAIIGLTDGDKGDITVSSSGTVWTIDARAVTYPKMPAMSTTSRLLGKGDTIGTGDIEEISLGSGLLMSGTSLELQLKTVNNQIVRGTGNISTPYTLSVQALTSSPVDAQTIYFGNLPKAPVTVAATSKVYIPRAGTIKRAEIYCYSGTAGTNQAWSGYVRLNNTTDTLIATLSVATNERVFSNSALSITVVAGDYIEIKFINPTWATNPLTTIFGGYIYIE